MTQNYVIDFIKAVYPECTELTIRCNTEETCLRDATELIIELRNKVAYLKAKYEPN